MTAMFKSMRTYKRKSTVSELKRLRRTQRTALRLRPKNCVDAQNKENKLEAEALAKKYRAPVAYGHLHPTKGYRIHWA